MANQVELLPKADYTVGVVGPSKSWGFDGNDGTRVEMATDSVQFVGHEEYWVDVSRTAKAEKPKPGEVFNGTIAQDEDGKFPPKFNKTKQPGRGSFGGGQAGPGAVWSAAVGTAAHVVAGYYAASGSKPKNISEYLSKIEALAPKINSLVDKLVGSNAPKPAAAANSEAGETAAPAPKATAAKSAPKEVAVADIEEEELGEW